VRRPSLLVGVWIVVSLIACTGTSSESTPQTGPVVSAGVSTSSGAPTPRPVVDPASFDPRNAVVPGFVPRAVLFLDEDHGVLGGRIECPKRCEGQHDGILAATDDGGVTWKLTRRIKTPITHLTANPGTGAIWATASTCDYFLEGCGRWLLRSVDEGTTWTTKRDWVVNPAFATADLGFGAGTELRDGLHIQSSAITRDGGKTWGTQPGPCGGEQNMTVGFSFPSSDLGWAACASSEPGAGFFQFKAVYRTTDGGASWATTARFSPGDRLGSGLWANGGALGIHMFADGNGFFWAGGGFAYLVRTADGGHTWRTVWEDPGGGTEELSDISWLDPTDAFAVRWRASFGWDVARTRDGGRRWSSVIRWPTHD
jgi:hypothetical protein